MEGIHNLTLSLRKSVLLTIALLFAVASTVAKEALPAQDDSVIEVAYVEFPPYEYTNEQGEAAGIFIELTRRTLARAGLTPRFHQLPIARIYLYLQEGRIDLWPGLAGIPALQEHVLESTIAPFQTRLTALYLEGTPPIKSIEDMQGHRVILISGYTYGGLLYQFRNPANNFQIVTARTHQSALQMLKLDRGDYLLDYEAPISSLLKKRPVQNLRTVSLVNQQSAFILSRQAPHAEELMQRLEDAYYELLMENQLEDIIGESSY